MSKELPRYKVVDGYEEELNKDYLLTIKETLGEVIKTLDENKNVESKPNTKIS